MNGLNRKIHARSLDEFLEECRVVMRLRRLSYQTEKTYIFYIRGFIKFHNRRPENMAADEVRAYLSFLAVHKRVAASTQNVAFNALIFLYKRILETEIEDIADVVRARRTRRLPVVLSRNEVRLVLRQLQGTEQLLASLLYGAGLRVSEGLKLRVKDVDFDATQLIVRGGKGDKDRVHRSSFIANRATPRTIENSS